MTSRNQLFPKLSYQTKSKKSNVKKKDKNDLDNKQHFKKNFDSCLGAIKIIKDGWETEAIPEKSEKSVEKRGFFAKLFWSR